MTLDDEPDGGTLPDDLGPDLRAPGVDAAAAPDREPSTDTLVHDVNLDAGRADLGPDVVPIPPAVGEVVPRALDWTRAGGVLAFTFETTAGPSGSLAVVDALGQVEPWSESQAPRLEGAEDLWLVRAGGVLYAVWTGTEHPARFAVVNARGQLGAVREVTAPTNGPALHRVVDVAAIPGSLFLVVSTDANASAPRRVLRQATSGEPADLWPVELAANSARRFLPVQDGSHAVGLWFQASASDPGLGWLELGWFELTGSPRADPVRITSYTASGSDAFTTASLLGAVTTEAGLFIVVAERSGSHGTSVWGLRRNDFAESSGRLDPWPPVGATYAFDHATFLRGGLNEIVFAVHHPTSNPRRFWVDVHRVNPQRELLGMTRLDRTAAVVAYEGGLAVGCVGESGAVTGLRCHRQSVP